MWPRFLIFKPFPILYKTRSSANNLHVLNEIYIRDIFDSRGIVHKEFVPPGQTVNQAFYQEVLGRLRQRVMRVRHDIASSCIIHHDNAPNHTSLAVREFLAEKQIAVLPHPPYSPHLAPCDVFIFPKIFRIIKGTISVH
jgi:hypothetical protein